MRGRRARPRRPRGPGSVPYGSDADGPGSADEETALARPVDLSSLPRPPSRLRRSARRARPRDSALLLPPQERRHVERRHRLEFGAEAERVESRIGGRRPGPWPPASPGPGGATSTAAVRRRRPRPRSSRSPGTRCRSGDRPASWPPRRSAGATPPTRSKPVAITVILTRPSIFGSTTAPKMMFASSCAASWMIADASLTSISDRSDPPVTLMMTPRAPLTDASSSSGLETASVGRVHRAAVALRRCRCP